VYLLLAVAQQWPSLLAPLFRLSVVCGGGHTEKHTGRKLFHNPSFSFKNKKIMPIRKMKEKLRKEEENIQIIKRE
jgi:hypothetical protein